MAIGEAPVDDAALSVFISELTSAPDGSRAAEVLRAGGGRALSRAEDPEHFTASCVVFDLSAPAPQVLLQLHRRTGRWMQFGGHIEPADGSFAAAACRELREESGLHRLRWLSPAPLSVSDFLLPATARQCTRHWDVCFAADATREAHLLASAESERIGWFDLTALPAAIMPDLPTRLPRLHAAALRAASAAPPE